jgi:hypothetical protein
MKSSDNTLLLAGLFVLIVVIIALIVYYTRQGETKTVEQTSDTTKLTVENLTFKRTLNPDPSVGDGVSGYTIEPYGVEYTGSVNYTELSRNVTFTMNWTNAPGFNNVVKGFKIEHYVDTAKKHMFEYNSEINGVDGESISFSDFGGCTVKLTSANWTTQGNVIGQNKFKLFAVRIDETADNILYDGTVATTFPPELKISESQLSATLSMTTPETATFKPEKEDGTSTRAVIYKTVYDISNEHTTLTKNDIGIYLETVENTNNKHFYFQYEDGKYLLEDLSKGVPTTANPKLKVEIVNKETGTLIGEIKKVGENKYLSSPKNGTLGLYATNDARITKEIFAGFKWTFNERISKTLMPHGAADFELKDDAAMFGYTVCVFGDDAFVGQPGYVDVTLVDGKDKGGRVHIYRRNTTGVWEFKKTITSLITGTYPVKGAQFGCSISISKDYAVIGEIYNSDWKGKVYILKRDADGNWETRTQGVLNNDASISDEQKQRYPISIEGTTKNELFGSSVAISDKFLVVGAPGLPPNRAPSNNTEKGSIKLYKFINKTGAISVEFRDGKEGKTNGELFGYAVDISGDRVIVGAPYKGGVAPDKSCDFSSNERAHCPDTDTTNAVNTGSVSIYKMERDENLKEKLVLEREINPRTSSIQTEGKTFFGESVAIDGMIAVIGMPGKRGYSTLQSDNANVGAVYVLKGDGDRKIRNPNNPAPVVRWGYTEGYGELIFDRTITDKVTGGGEEGEDIMLPAIPNVRKNGEFGKSVSISGDTICIGQPGGSGDVYVYKYKLVNTDKYFYGAAKQTNNSNNPENESRIKLDLVKTIKSPTGTFFSSGSFGKSVSNSDGYVMIGEPNGAPRASRTLVVQTGAAYITAI